MFDVRKLLSFVSNWSMEEIQLYYQIHVAGTAGFKDQSRRGRRFRNVDAAFARVFA